MTLGVRKMKLMGAAAVALLAMGASGCSSLPTVPDWVDPTTWFGGDEPAADNGQAPDLASVPDKPTATTPDEQQKVAESLAGDRANAKYSAEALRGGTEPAATPPADAAPKAAEEKPVAKAAPVAAAAPAAPVDRSLTSDPAGSAARPGTLPAAPAGMPADVADTAQPAQPVKTADAAPLAPVKSGKKSKKVKPVQVAETATPPVEAAAAPVARMQVATVSPSDAELGFKPSSAPPLDASVAQFVAAPIVDRYRSTAAQAGMAQSAPSAYAAAQPVHKVRHRAKPVTTAVAAAEPPVRASRPMGGPATMEGKVVANLDAINAAPAPVYANPNGASAVVFFPNDSVGLSADGRAQVRAAVDQFKSSGGASYVRVVGHSSSRTPNMSAEKHLEVIFKKSQDRANSVARALIQAGVPADHVLVEAVGDTQPVYYESMPKGEDGNRRAEIFVGG